MTESFWESEVMVAIEPETELEPEIHVELQETMAAPAEEPRALTLSTDEFAALEERVLRAVTLVKQERQTRLAAEERAAQAEAQLREQSPRVQRMETELASLNAERNQVRQRVEKLLTQLDALEL
jgi:uncharacterized protein (DUF3084 family)